MTPTMLRSVLTKTARKNEEEKETDQLGLSLIEHRDSFDENPSNTSKPESPLRRILSSPLKSIRTKDEASYYPFENIISVPKDVAEKQETAPLFCSPFRRRKKQKKLEETYLNREEALQMYLNKLDEEANYFTVKEEREEDICTCTTCIASYEVLYADYMHHSKTPQSVTSESASSDDTVPEQFTVDIMQSMLQAGEKKHCVIM